MLEFVQDAEFEFIQPASLCSQKKGMLHFLIYLENMLMSLYAKAGRNSICEYSPAHNSTRKSRRSDLMLTTPASSIR